MKPWSTNTQHRVINVSSQFQIKKNASWTRVHIIIVQPVDVCVLYLSEMIRIIFIEYSYWRLFVENHDSPITHIFSSWTTWSAYAYDREWKRRINKEEKILWCKFYIFKLFLFIQAGQLRVQLSKKLRCLEGKQQIRREVICYSWLCLHAFAFKLGSDTIHSIRCSENNQRMFFEISAARACMRALCG